jgi:medium-chain acyl-[acyl-carrier-protein] hydrolase
MSPPLALEIWLPFRSPRPAATKRLFCLPFVGGGASVYRGWTDLLPLTVDVCAIQLPGRETRFREQPFDRLQPLVASLADALSPVFDLPFALYGHSMGALTAFELARELRRRGSQRPFLLIVTGRVAPHVAPRQSPLHTLPDPEFRAELRRLDGTPAAVLDSEELMRLYMPVLRADFAAHETYEYLEEPPLDCPIMAITGVDDSLAAPNEMGGWRRHTAAAFEAHVVPGGHFFLQSHAHLLHRLIARRLVSE